MHYLVKKLLLLLIITLLVNLSYSQYWQQQVNFLIEVSLNEKEKSLDGYERLEYINNSPDTLSYIWFHLWSNAYKNDKTAFSEQLLRNGNTKFYFSDKEEKGYMNRLDFKVNGLTARIEDHPQYIDIVKVILPSPLPPKEKAIITTPFHVKLPFNFSRGGYDGSSFQVTQWYPKPAVYDLNGWHPMPYLDQGEFFSEFGNYDVRITLPKDFVVAATGLLQNQEEISWMKSRIDAPAKKKAISSRSPTSKNAPKKPVEETVDISPSGTKSLRYLQENIHDFAWFANKDFIVNYDSCQLQSGRVIDVYTFYTEKEKQVWKNSVQHSKDAIRFYSNEVGEYPYDIISAVQGPPSFGGGMEYPTITVISPMATEQQLDIVLAHEIGHNWFYGILASNEREHPWMDEGINSFYDKKYTLYKYGTDTNEEELVLQTLIKQHKDQPITTRSEDFTSLNYGTVAYHKTAVWLQLVEEKLGEEKFKQTLQEYYNKWKFKHPYPKDFYQSLKANNELADYVFELPDNTGPLPNQTLTGSSLISPLIPKSFSNYLKKSTKTAIILSPAIGYNSYDKFMLGGLVTNYKLPPSALQFVAVPLYAFGSKKFNGIGKVSFTSYPLKTFQKIEFFLNGSMFSMNKFTDGLNKDHYSGFTKFSPVLEITFKEKNLHSTKRKYIQLRSYFISEKPFRISFDTLFTGIDTLVYNSVTNESLNFNIHQLRLGIENTRALYPYNANFTAQASKEFIRLTFEGNYFFNYAKGGLSLRLFGGKFFYNQDDNYPYGYYIERFFLNMTGANGEEDYTYSNYFVGRNKFEGILSRQIMVRDGGFKIRTDLNANKVGKTGDWLIAANLNTTIPDNLNPLSVLPIKIPIRLFADVGTYAEAWEPDAETDRFLFDAGLHIPLFNETVNLYFPIIYSKPFNDYVKSIYPKNKLWNTMSFTLSLDKTISEIKRQLPL